MAIDSSQPTTAPTPADATAAFVERHFRWNAGWLVFENAGFLVAIAFVSSVTVMPALVAQLGGTPTLIGLIGTCQTAGWLLPQLVGAGLCGGKPRMLPYIFGPLYVGRPAFLVVAAALLLIGAGNPPLTFAVFYIAVFAFFATDGLASVAWYELIGKTVPTNRRGRMFGSAQIVGGLGGVAVGGLVAWILERPDLPFPSNYAVLFGISGLLFLLNLIPFRLVREPDGLVGSRDGQPETFSVRTFAAQLLPILRQDRNFVRLVGARLLFGAAMTTAPFYILLMGQVFGLGQEWIGLFLSAQLFGGLVGGLVVGWVADHLGTRTAIRLSGIVGAALPAITLGLLATGSVSGPAVPYVGSLLFLLVGLIGSANMIAFVNYLLEVAPLERRTTYVGLFNTLAGALLVVPTLAGWFLQVTSFGALFGVALVLSATCVLVSIGLRKARR
jgi:MFS family permease